MTTDRHRDWKTDEIRSLALGEIDERLQRYRLEQPQLERNMTRSLKRYGQISPVVVCLHDQQYTLIDGFKRLRAARGLQGMTHLKARRMDVDEQGAKAAVYNLNCIGQRPAELEEAWIVQALVREDGLSQIEVAQLLGRHKSWVSRRLAMLERLCEEASQQLQMGLLTPAMARQLTRLPRGNQADALKSAREASLTSRELTATVDLLLASSTQEQTNFVLRDPRRAIRQAEDHYVHYWDPRMSTAGNRVAKRLTILLDGLAKMQSWLRYQGRSELQACDRETLQSGFERLAAESRLVAEASSDFIRELKLP